jgi:hypothetical protein
MSFLGSSWRQALIILLLVFSQVLNSLTAAELSQLMKGWVIDSPNKLEKVA